jgi:hypothetical protein
MGRFAVYSLIVSVTIATPFSGYLQINGSTKKLFRQLSIHHLIDIFQTVENIKSKML